MKSNTGFPNAANDGVKYVDCRYGDSDVVDIVDAVDVVDSGGLPRPNAPYHNGSGVSLKRRNGGLRITSPTSNWETESWRALRD